MVVVTYKKQLEKIIYFKKVGVVLVFQIILFVKSV
jgi:hypothetical protein